jgi:hypothetical protein
MTIKTAMKSEGQIAYENDVTARPNYDDGSPRPLWNTLSDDVRWSWHRNPTPRYARMANGVEVVMKNEPPLIDGPQTKGS